MWDSILIVCIRLEMKKSQFLNMLHAFLLRFDDVGQKERHLEVSDETWGADNEILQGSDRKSNFDLCLHHLFELNVDICKVILFRRMKVKVTVLGLLGQDN